jgi:hypothetical protein
MPKPTFICSHFPQCRLEYSCKETGDYYLELCKECRELESMAYLVKEEILEFEE